MTEDATQGRHEFLPECDYQAGPAWTKGVCVCPELKACEARIRADASWDSFTDGYAACAKEASEAVQALAAVGDQGAAGIDAVLRSDVLAALDGLPAGTPVVAEPQVQAEPPTVYACEACPATFTGTADEAFAAGWDTPERFVSRCTCPNCTIDKTVWWKLFVDKHEPTEQDVLLISAYNAMHHAAALRAAATASAGDSAAPAPHQSAA